jgi:uncharacterized metal-binding protein
MPTQPRATPGEKLIFSCSGAADVAEIADRAARQLSREGAGKMFCLAGVGGRVADIVERTAAASGIVVIDGCEKDCGKHCLLGAGITAFAHVRVTDLGMDKGKSPPDVARVATVMAAAAAGLSAAS